MNVKILKDICVLICMSFLLTSCSGSHDAKYYVRHPEALKSGLMACEQIAQPNQNPQCVRLMKIYNQLVTMGNSLIKNPEVFGQSIITKQIQLAKLKSQIDSSKDQDQLSALKKQYDALDQQIQLMLTMVAQAEGM